MSDWNIEWLNQNQNRAYPLQEDCSRRDELDNVTLPNRILADLVFVTPVSAGLSCYLSKVVYAAGQLELYLADSNAMVMASVTVDLTTHTANARYELVGQNDYVGSYGIVVIGSVESLEYELPYGVYTFDATATPFEARVVRPDLRGVRQLQTVDAAGTISPALTDTVRLVAGQNVRLTYIPPVYTTTPDPITGVDVQTVSVPGAIRIDAISGENLDADCGCTQSYPKPTPIRSINGVFADANGNFTLTASGGRMSISAAGNGVSIADDTTAECAGCTELEDLTKELQILEDTIAKLEERHTRLYDNFTNFNTVVRTSLG